MQSKRESSAFRVLHVLESTLGGTLRYLENLASALEGADIGLGLAFSTSRADSRFQPFLERIRRQGWDCYETAMQREVSLPADLKSCRQICAAIRRFRPDILHCHSSKAGALGRLAAKLTFSKAAIVYSPHAIAAPLGSHYLQVERLLANFTDRFIAVSDSEARQLIELGLCSQSNVDVVYPTIDCDHFQPRSRDAAKRDLQLDPSPLVLGIGRITAQKDPLAFLEVLRLASQKLPNIRAAWVGDGPDKEQFQKAIRNKGLQGSVRVVPWLHDIRPYLAAADVLLSTSRFESFGYMVAEALAMEVSVVATAITGTTDVMVGDLTKNLYQPGDLDSAADLIRQSLKGHERAAQLAAASRLMIAERFSRRRLLNSLIASYHALLGQSGSSQVSQQEVW